MLLLVIVKVIGDGLEGSYGPEGSIATRGKKNNAAEIAPNIVAIQSNPERIISATERRFRGDGRGSVVPCRVGFTLRPRERGIHQLSLATGHLVIMYLPTFLALPQRR